MKLVLDTDVIVAALRSPSGASAALLRLVEEDRVTLLLSVALALEYDAICQLPEHCMAAGISQGDARMFVTTLISMAKPVEIHFRWRPQVRDAIAVVGPARDQPREAKWTSHDSMAQPGPELASRRECAEGRSLGLAQQTCATDTA